MSDGFLEEDRRDYTDLSTVESQRNDLTAEEFPEGAYGSGIETGPQGKSKPWRIDQRSSQSFDFEYHDLHEGMKRDYPGEDVFDDTIPDDVRSPRMPESE